MKQLRLLPSQKTKYLSKYLLGFLAEQRDIEKSLSTAHYLSSGGV